MKSQTSVITLLAAMLGACPSHAVSDDEEFQNRRAPPPLAVNSLTPQRAPHATVNDEAICGTADYAQQVVELTNMERFNNGALAPLKAAGELNDSSYLHSVAMAERNFFAHCDLDTGKSPWERMEDAGYYWNWAGENIAAGYSTPDAVVTAWMNSAGHRANILDPNFREIGNGYYHYAADTPDTRRDSNGDCEADGQANGSYYRYWTQNFGTRNSIYPVVINLEAHMTEQYEVGLYVYGQGWATEMRIRNNTGAWTDWMPYSDEMVWRLDVGNGFQTVSVEIRNARGSVHTASDEICLVANEPAPQPVLIFSDGFD